MSDPGWLAMADREKAVWDDTVKKLVGMFKETCGQADSTVAFVQLLEGLRDCDKWQLLGTLSAAIQQLSEAS